MVRHTSHSIRRKQGDQMNLYVLQIWLQQQDQWKLLARQAAKL